MSGDVTQQLPDGDMKQVLALLNSINERLTALEEKVDRRLQETRPIWEQVLERLTKIETRLGKIEDEVFWLRRKFRNWAGDLAKLEEKYDDLEERFEESDSERSR